MYINGLHSFLDYSDNGMKKIFLSEYNVEKSPWKVSLWAILILKSNWAEPELSMFQSRCGVSNKNSNLKSNPTQIRIFELPRR